jgi:hypothetical protein
LSEVINSVQDGLATAEDIDAMMSLGRIIRRDRRLSASPLASMAS